ncbi:MAG: protein-L-isoaspartate O-methyltransferase [Haloferacaceae archaeon]
MEPAVLREDMVDGLEYSLEEFDEAVNVAMRTVPRHEFLDAGAYDNRPNEDEGTRVLAPATVARMLTALAPEPGHSVLVVGAGIGYTTAVLAEIVGAENVQAIDIARRIVYVARQNLAAAGYGAVLVDRGDGADGLPEYAPYDRILLEASAVEPPRALVDQLATGGRLVMPLGAGEQSLVAVEADETLGEAEVVGRYGPVALGPMLVEGEQAGSRRRNRTHREDAEFAEQGYFAKHGWEYDWVDWEDHL